jgi:hypothetical protein
MKNIFGKTKFNYYKKTNKRTNLQEDINITQFDFFFLVLVKKN